MDQINLLFPWIRTAELSANIAINSGGCGPRHCSLNNETQPAVYLLEGELGAWGKYRRDGARRRRPVVPMQPAITGP